MFSLPLRRYYEREIESQPYREVARALVVIRNQWNLRSIRRGYIRSLWCCYFYTTDPLFYCQVTDHEGVRLCHCIIKVVSGVFRPLWVLSPLVIGEESLRKKSLPLKRRSRMECFTSSTRQVHAFVVPFTYVATLTFQTPNTLGLFCFYRFYLLNSPWKWRGRWESWRPTKQPMEGRSASLAPLS